MSGKSWIIVSADIGGTNTRFILSRVDRDGSPVPLFTQKYRNEDFSSFSLVFSKFLFDDAKVSSYPDSACFAVAGPVKDNRVVFTNRSSWTIDGDLLAKEFKIPRVLLINDFLAVGYGLLTLKENVECICLQAAEKRGDAPIACIGAGTGLGECFLTPTNGGYACFSSEGGHAEFAPRTEIEIELLQFLKHKFEQKHRISVERVVSGPGLASIYEFLSIKFPASVDPRIHSEIAAAGDLKGAVIASNTSNELCRQTMEIFASAYGSEAGVAALKWLPFGGLYLTGGLTPKNIHWIQDPEGPFMKAFYDKGRVSGLLKSIPVYAVMVEDLGERGAQFVASNLVRELEANKSIPSGKVESSSVFSVPAIGAAAILGGLLGYFFARK